MEFGLREAIGEGIIWGFQSNSNILSSKEDVIFGPAFIPDQWIDLRFETRYWQTMSKHRVNSKHCQDGQQPDDKRTRTTSTVTSWVITSSSSSMGRCHSFLSSDWLVSAKEAPYWLINSEGQSEISCHNTMSTICLRHRQSRHLYLSSKWVGSLHLVLFHFKVLMIASLYLTLTQQDENFDAAVFIFSLFSSDRSSAGHFVCLSFCLWWLGNLHINQFYFIEHSLWEFLEHSQCIFTAFLDKF